VQDVVASPSHPLATRLKDARPKMRPHGAKRTRFGERRVCLSAVSQNDKAERMPASAVA